MKFFLKFIILLISLFIIINIISEILVISFAIKAKPKKSDVIIVLGCAIYGKSLSPFFMARLNDAIKLYKNGYGKFIIVSGGKGAGEDISEAEAGRQYLIKMGIDKNAILTDDKSYSTYQNLENSKKIMENWSLKTAIIVSNKFHLKRASVIASKLNIDASFSGVFMERYLYDETYGYLREAPAYIYTLFK